MWPRENRPGLGPTRGGPPMGGSLVAGPQGDFSSACLHGGGAKKSFLTGALCLGARTLCGVPARERGDLGWGRGVLVVYAPLGGFSPGDDL